MHLLFRAHVHEQAAAGLPRGLSLPCLQGPQLPDCACVCCRSLPCKNSVLFLLYAKILRLMLNCFGFLSVCRRLPFAIRPCRHASAQTYPLPMSCFMRSSQPVCILVRFSAYAHIICIHIYDIKMYLRIVPPESNPVLKVRGLRVPE